MLNLIQAEHQPTHIHEEIQRKNSAHLSRNVMLLDNLLLTKCNVAKQPAHKEKNKNKVFQKEWKTRSKQAKEKCKRLHFELEFHI